jgi:hypothetical protein
VDDRKRAQMQAAGVQHIMRDFADLPDMVMRFVRPPQNDNTPPQVPTLDVKPNGPRPYSPPRL